MGLNGLMHHLEIHILTRDNMKHRDCKCTQQMWITTQVTHRRMHYSPLPCGTCLLCAAPLVLSVSRGDPQLLSPGQPSCQTVNMRLTNAISAGLCIHLVEHANTLVLSTITLKFSGLVTLQVPVLGIYITNWIVHTHKPKVNNVFHASLQWRIYASFGFILILIYDAYR